MVGFFGSEGHGVFFPGCLLRSPSPGNRRLSLNSLVSRWGEGREKGLWWLVPAASLELGETGNPGSGGGLGYRPPTDRHEPPWGIKSF